MFLLSIYTNILSHVSITIINTLFGMNKYIYGINIEPSLLTVSNYSLLLLKVKLFFYSVFTLITLFFFLYYSTLYCYIFPKAQIQWMINCLLCGGINLTYTLLYALLSTFIFYVLIRLGSSYIMHYYMFILFRY